MAQDIKKQTAAYLPWKTFLTALDQLHGHGVPNKIDHSFFQSFSGIVRSQVISAFRFLNLISDDGEPQQHLHDLANKKEERKALVKQMLERSYPDLMAKDLTKITPAQFIQEFEKEQYAVSGDTRQKARVFFLKAAEFAGTRLSPLLTKRMAPVRSARARRAGSGATAHNNGHTVTTDRQAPNDIHQASQRHSQSGGTTKTINLSNAGTLTVSVNVNIMELNGKDREFVFNLIDQLKAHEAQAQEKPEF